MIRKRTAPSPVPLSACVVRVLLSGWSAPLPEHETDDGLFALWQSRSAGAAALWRQHEAYLRAEATRLYVSPTWAAVSVNVSSAKTCSG